MDIVQISLWSCRQKVKSSADGKPMYCHRWSCHNGPVPLFKKQLTRHMCSSGVVVLWVQNLTANLNDGVHRLQARKADGELNLQKKASDASAPRRPGPLMRLDGDGPMPGTSFLSQEAPALVLSFRFLIMSKFWGVVVQIDCWSARRFSQDPELPPQRFSTFTSNSPTFLFPLMFPWTSRTSPPRPHLRQRSNHALRVSYQRPVCNVSPASSRVSELVTLSSSCCCCSGMPRRRKSAWSQHKVIAAL